MAAPTVTRPPITVNEPKAASSAAFQEWAKYAIWVAFTCLGLGVVAMIVALVIGHNESLRVEARQEVWDTVYKAIKDKHKSEELIPALEGVAEQVKGTAPHAYVLMRLGDLYFDRSLQPARTNEERGAALQKALSLYTLVATSEPYAHNPTFGPIALSNAAKALEQANRYDDAIALIHDHIPSDQHWLHSKLVAQLGRLYWLRAGIEDQNKQTEKAEADKKEARAKLSEAINASASIEHSDNVEWRKQAEYIRSLVENYGKVLPDGKAPPVKPDPATLPKIIPELHGPTDPVIHEPPMIQRPASMMDSAAPAPVVPAAVKAEAAPKAAEPKADKKDEKKAEPAKDNKQGRLDLNSDPAPIPATHLSYAQLQQLLKDGKPAFCQCPRCLNTGKAVEAKLAE